MNFVELKIKGVYKIVPNLMSDDRGDFFRYYCKDKFKAITSNEFVQMNHSINHKKGTLRGMHYQLPPHGEEKLVRCIKGEIYDVFVDLRKDSPTFLKWEHVILSEENKEMLFLPKGIAHGFITLQDDSHVLYQHTEFYNPEAERGLQHDDPRVNIEWPIPIETISERDQNHGYLSENFNGLEL